MQISNQTKTIAIAQSIKLHTYINIVIIILKGYQVSGKIKRQKFTKVVVELPTSKWVCLRLLAGVSFHVSLTPLQCPPNGLMLYYLS